MKWFMKILLAAFIMFVASAAPVYADDDEGNEANENGSGSDSEDDEKESTPGFEVAFAVAFAVAFEVAFAVAGALAAARLFKARVL
jgi:hypothetical protein